ncbi:MAG TPA: hypothetical protein VH640_07600 [Bryobacteraceae bacterium]
MTSVVLAFGFAIAHPLFMRGQLPFEPPREAGTGVTGAFEGWFKNSDGSFSLLLGYFNRNEKQELDIPIGSNNQIEPGGPDRGQPTHFLPGRHWGLFTIKVPAGFVDKITWTISANGETTVIPASLKPDYELSPFQESSGNTPPVLRLEEAGASVQGPQGLTAERTVKLNSPLPLTVWVSDDLKTGKGSVIARNQKSPVIVRWTKYRGPGVVTFAKDSPEVEKLQQKDVPFSGKAATTASFSEPGDYELHVVINDLTGDGGGGFQCCWTNGLVKVVVEP